MTAWRDVEQAEPEFAQRVRELFDAHKHKTIATLRADGSPRISGIEVVIEHGELTFGSMSNARKGADLRRDPRFALHSATVDPVDGAEAQWPGEAKVSGRAIAVVPTAGNPGGDHYRADIAEVVHTHLNEGATMLVVEWWTPTQGFRRVERGQSPKTPGPDVMELRNEQFQLPPLSSPSWSGPIVLLTGPHAVSAAENFMQMLVGAGRISTVVGQRSAGTNGNITLISLPGALAFSYTGMEVRNPDGSVHHGVGIAPDVLVPRAAVDYRDGVDRDLLAGIDAMRAVLGD